jgi:hypothetical protein
MGNLVNRDFEPTLAQAGDTVNIPVPPSMTANNLSDGGTVQNQSLTLGNAQIVLNTHAESTFQIPDVAKVLAVPDLLQIYMQPAMVAIAERIESDLLGLYSGFNVNPVVGAPATAITEEAIDAAETALFVGKVPMGEPKFLVVDANTYSQLRQIPRFSEYNSVGDAGLRAVIDGTVGRLKDFFVFRSQLVQRTGLPTVTTHNIAFAKNAIGLVVRRLPQPIAGTGAVSHYAELGNFGMRVTMSYQPNTLAQQFTVDVLYGCAVIRNASGVQVNS